MTRFLTEDDELTEAKARSMLDLPLQLGGTPQFRGTSSSWVEIAWAAHAQLGASGDDAPPDAVFGIEVNADVHSGTAQIRLYDVSDSAAVTGTTHTVTSDRVQAVEEITLIPGHVYTLQYRMSASGSVSLWGARIRQSYS